MVVAVTAVDECSNHPQTRIQHQQSRRRRRKTTVTTTTTARTRSDGCGGTSTNSRRLLFLCLIGVLSWSGWYMSTIAHPMTTYLNHQMNFFSSTTNETLMIADSNNNNNTTSNRNSMNSLFVPPLSFLSSMNLTQQEFYQRNYFYRVWMMSSTSTSSNNNNIGNNNNNNNNSNNISSTTADLPAPMTVLTRYISEHSHQQLELEWNDACGQQQQQQQQPPLLNQTRLQCRLNEDQQQKSQRRYLVATYSCPIESGNRLHRFMNGFLWAILTNRTLLWRYETYEVCTEYQEENCRVEYEQQHITGPGDCQGLLARSPWIPSYDEWKDKLGFTTTHNPVTTTTNHSTNSSSTTTSTSNNNRSRIVRAKIATQGDPHIDDTTLPFDGPNPNTHIHNEDIRLIRTGKLRSLDPGSILSIRSDPPKSMYLSQQENLDRLALLRSHGVYFLYGMLFESLFTLDPSLDPSPALWSSTKDDNDTDTETTTIFLHSRNPGNRASTYIWPEHLCLERLMNVMNTTTSHTTVDTNRKTKHSIPTSNVVHTTPSGLQPCHIYIMSDRPVTVGLLHEEVRNTTHCTSSSRDQTPAVIQSSSSVSFRSEHGPRAGRGFWEDVALAIRARQGMISFTMMQRFYVRTSTALVREIIEFRRVLEHHHQQQQQQFSLSSWNGDKNNDNNNDDDDNGGGGGGGVIGQPKQELPVFFSCQNPWKEKKR